MFSMINFDPNFYLIEQILQREEVPIMESWGKSASVLTWGCLVLLKMTTSYQGFKGGIAIIESPSVSIVGRSFIEWTPKSHSLSRILCSNYLQNTPIPAIL